MNSRIAQPLRGVRSGLLRASCPPPLRGRLRYATAFKFAPGEFTSGILPCASSRPPPCGRCSKLFRTILCRTLGAAQHRTLVLRCHPWPFFANAKAACERLHHESPAATSPRRARSTTPAPLRILDRALYSQSLQCTQSVAKKTAGRCHWRQGIAGQAASFINELRCESENLLAKYA